MKDLRGADMRIRMQGLIVIVFLLISLTAWGQSMDTLREQAGVQALREPTPIVDFTLPDLQGNQVSLSAFKGKVVLLNFWATWCPPCRKEIPSMERLYKKYGDQGFEIVGVDLQESHATVADFVKEFGMTYTVLLDNKGETGATYGARSIPTSYIIDRSGNAVSGVVGTKEWDSDEVTRYIQALLDAK